MKKQTGIKDILIPTLALFLICLVATLALSYTNFLTEGRISEVKKNNADKARKVVCADAAGFELLDADEDTEIYSALDAAGNEIGYAVTTFDKSYGGDIQVMTGFDTEGNITGVQILTINDTPGLGMNAKKDGFRNQYIGKPAGNLVVSKNASGDEIQAITGATRTSEAVTRCVNKAGALIFGGGDGNE